MTLYRCHKCSKGFDVDLDGVKPKRFCSECGSSLFENNKINLKPEEQLRLYEEYGVWFLNTEDPTWLDKKILDIGKMDPGRRQDKAESVVLRQLREAHRAL